MLNLGAVIRSRRQELGLRAEDVASKANISIRTLYRIEQGEDTTGRTLSRLASTLDLTLSELYRRAAS